MGRNNEELFREHELVGTSVYVGGSKQVAQVTGVFRFKNGGGYKRVQVEWPSGRKQTVRARTLRKVDE